MSPIKDLYQYWIKMRSLLVYVVSIFGISSFIANAQQMTDEEFSSIFGLYVGLWEGEYKIFSEQDELLNDFKVSREYWWAGDELRGKVVYDFGDNQKTFHNRILLVDSVPFTYVADSPGAADPLYALRGEYVNETLVWLRDLSLVNDGFQARINEQIVNDEFGVYLQFWGDQQAIDAEGNKLVVAIEGFLAYRGDDDRQNEEPATSQEIVDADPVIQEMAPPANDPEPVSTQRGVPRDDNTMRMLNSLNIVGIRDDGENSKILVDYYLLYGLGEALNNAPDVRFAAITASELIFEDNRGAEYRIIRKDQQG